MTDRIWKLRIDPRWFVTPEPLTQRKIETEEEFVERIEKLRKRFLQRDQRKRAFARKLRPYQDWCMYGGAMPPKPAGWKPEYSDG